MNLELELAYASLENAKKNLMAFCEEYRSDPEHSCAYCPMRNNKSPVFGECIGDKLESLLNRIKTIKNSY